MRLKLLFFLLLATAAPALAQKVYWLLWFDTEDYVLPAADDAALRLAKELDSLKVRATFKVVGEKARVLEQRGRRDVIEALRRHDIGYHSDNHSVPPTPAVYMSKLGWVDGAQEFERREGPGLRDVERIFGKPASCYGQPGSSWGPQSLPALRKLGVPHYVDEARHVQMNNQPFWYGGLLHVYNLGPYSLRADINNPAKLPSDIEKFDAAVAELKRRGGGVMQTYYHPTEFVTTEFWDGVNFKYGQYTAPNAYRMPKQRTKELSEQAYRIFIDFVRHVRQHPDVEILTAADLPLIFPAITTQPTKQQVREAWTEGIKFTAQHSAAEMLLALLDLKPRVIDGPSAKGETTWALPTIPRAVWEHALADTRVFIEQNGRLPANAWLDSATISIGDFAATLAHAPASGDIPIRKAPLFFQAHIATDGKKNFNWVIHPEGFDGSSLLDLGRLEAWTLKPAILNRR